MSRRQPLSPRGFTLLELSLVICVLMTLIGAGFYATSSYQSWKAGRLASESLRTVYIAQRTYLADNPTRRVADLTAANLLPYLPNNAAALPTIRALNGAVLNIRVNVSPPFCTTGAVNNGARYDPSGNTTDSLWDVGE